MGKLILALLIAISTTVVCHAQSSKFQVIGSFGNIWSNGEHQNGFMLSLWKSGDGIVGYMSGGFGSRLVGDPPCGLIEEVVYSPKSRKLAFSVKFDRNELYRFSGTLSKKTVRGRLFEYMGTTVVEQKLVVFRYSSDWTEGMSGVESKKEMRESGPGRCRE